MPGPPPRTSNSLRSRRARSAIARGRRMPKREAGGWRIVAQAEVLGEREVEHEPAAVAILGDVADAGLEAGPCAVAGDLVALGDDAAGRRFHEAGDRLDQLALAVPVDAGDARRSRPPSPRTTLRARPRARGCRARPGRDGEERARRAGAAPFSTCSSTGRPTISSASSRSDVPAAATVATAFPRRRTVIRSATSSTSPSLWVMKMMDVPCSLSEPMTLEELVRLLRGQDCRGLVQDQEPRLAVERLQDLDPLLLGDADRLHPRLGTHRQAVALRQVAHVLLALL